MGQSMKKYNFKNEKLFWHIIDLDKKMTKEKKSNPFLLLKSLNEKQVQQLEKEYFYIEEVIYKIIKKQREYILSDDDHFEIPDSITSSGLETTNAFCNEEISVEELNTIKKNNYTHPLKGMTPENKEEQNSYIEKDKIKQIIEPINRKILLIKEANVFNTEIINYIENQKKYILNSIKNKKRITQKEKTMKDKLISVTLRELGFKHDDEIITNNIIYQSEQIEKHFNSGNKQIDFKDFDNKYIQEYSPSPINNVTKIRQKI